MDKQPLSLDMQLQLGWLLLELLAALHLGLPQAQQLQDKKLVRSHRLLAGNKDPLNYLPVAYTLLARQRRLGVSY